MSGVSPRQNFNELTNFYRKLVAEFVEQTLLAIMAVIALVVEPIPNSVSELAGTSFSLRLHEGLRNDIFWLFASNYLNDYYETGKK